MISSSRHPSRGTRCLAINRIGCSDTCVEVEQKEEKKKGQTTVSYTRQDPDMIRLLNVSFLSAFVSFSSNLPEGRFRRYGSPRMWLRLKLNNTCIQLLYIIQSSSVSAKSQCGCPSCCWLSPASTSASHIIPSLLFLILLLLLLRPHIVPDDRETSHRELRRREVKRGRNASKHGDIIESRRKERTAYAG